MAIQCCFQILVYFAFLQVIEYQVTSSSSSSHPFLLPSITCFRGQLLCKMWPVQSVFLRFIVGYSFHPCLFEILRFIVGYSCHPWLFEILHFSHNRPDWSLSPFSRTSFRNLQSFAICFQKFPSFSIVHSYRSKCSFIGWQKWILENHVARK